MKRAANLRRAFLKPFKSIRMAMLIPFTLLFVFTLMIFSLISLNYTEEAVLGNSIGYTSQLISQINYDIDSYIEYMENISTMVVHSGDVQQYLFNKGPTEDEENLFRRILTQFNTVVEARNDISNIAVVASNGECIINDGRDKLNKSIRLEDLDWYRSAMESEETTLTASHVQNAISNNYKWVVTLSRGIVDPYTGERTGVFFIDLNYKVLKDLCESNSLGPRGYIFITDENGKIIYHPRQQLLYSGLMKEKIKEILECEENYFLTEEGDDSKLYTMSGSGKTGWKVVGVAYTSDLMRSRDETQKIYILTASVLLTIAVLMIMLLSSAITQPVKMLKDSMKEVEQGNFDNASIETIDNNEIGSLGNSFNIMTFKIRQLMEQNIRVQEQKRLSELKALQSQINPHFLYNTLDSIIWMAEGGKNKEVVLMTSSLAKLLRQSISNESELVTIAEEVEYTRSYLTIQKMRYKDKLEFAIEVEPSILRHRIIKLVLQPIVENAIYHGIKYKESKGLVAVAGRREGGEILLEVTDNGIGMKEEELDHIFDERQDDAKNGGVGIYNVRTRLQLYYGPEYGITYKSVYGEGTTALIRIPAPEPEQRRI